MNARPYQVVVWGTTGVVGRLVAEHIARDYQKQGLKWAMAGRNKQKLEDIRRHLTSIDPTVKDVPILVADASNPQSLEVVTRSTKVVLATAGPFTAFGTPMVDSCVATGTNYCDITGETNWVRKMIREFDKEAKEKGIRIVPMAGFDSIPSDLGAFLVADHLRKQCNKACSRIECMFTDVKGCISGGTIVSLFGSRFQENSDDVKGFTDPYGLDPPDSSRGPDQPDSLVPGYSRLHNSWWTPFFMAPVNTKVVRRSNALMGHAYGKNFSYQETQRVPGRIAAYLGSLIFLFFGAAASLGPVRSLLLRVLPKPGQMPKREAMEGGIWKATVVGTSEEEAGKEPVRVEASLTGRGDPGYWTTSRMLLEAGLCIALQEEELNASGNLKAGVLTPAAAFGHVLIKRLNKESGGMFDFKISKA